MKITVNTTVSKEIELPLYFKSLAYPDHYYMTVGEKSAIEVTNFEMSESLILYPSIQVISLELNKHAFQKGIEPISEAEFKHAFTKVSLEIEKLLN